MGIKGEEGQSEDNSLFRRKRGEICKEKEKEKKERKEKEKCLIKTEENEKRRKYDTNEGRKRRNKKYIYYKLRRNV